MNLNAYDDVINKIDKKRTWIDIKTHTLLSREIKYRKYYVLCKRFNVKEQFYNYYIALLDEPELNKTNYKTIIDDYGRVKIKLHNLYNETNLRNIRENSNITINRTDGDNGVDVYELDI